jgi:hypothetical protein
MEDKHDVMTYVKLAEAAGFFLNSSFQYIDLAVTSELAGILFQEKLLTIPDNPKDLEHLANASIPTDTISLLKQKEFGKVLTSQTNREIATAWEQAQSESKTVLRKFHKSQVISSVQLIGHFNNFAFFIETLVNRHLLFLKQTKKLNSFSYNQIALSKVLNRIIFICKDEIENNSLHLNDINSLFSFRNKTVHYTPDNAKSLNINLGSLIRIWMQTVQLLKTFEEREQFNEAVFSQMVIENTQYFEKKWTN